MKIITPQKLYKFCKLFKLDKEQTHKLFNFYFTALVISGCDIRAVSAITTDLLFHICMEVTKTREKELWVSVLSPSQPKEICRSSNYLPSHSLLAFSEEILYNK